MSHGKCYILAITYIQNKEKRCVRKQWFGDFNKCMRPSRITSVVAAAWGRNHIRLWSPAMERRSTSNPVLDRRTYPSCPSSGSTDLHRALEVRSGRTVLRRHSRPVALSPVEKYLGWTQRPATTRWRRGSSRSWPCFVRSNWRTSRQRGTVLERINLPECAVYFYVYFNNVIQLLYQYNVHFYILISMLDCIWDPASKIFYQNLIFPNLTGWIVLTQS